MTPIPHLALAFAALALLAPQDAPAPRPDRPTPVFDTVAPELPPLRHPAVLIFSKTNGYRHGPAIEAAVPAIRALVEKRGWSAYATENAAVFNPAQLARFDVVVFASATGDLFTPEQREAFKAWIERGGGFVGLHGAGDASNPWPWYGERMIGTRFVGHPGGEHQFQTGDVVVTDRSHPATRHLPPRWRWTEEYYAFDKPPRADAHVLARLDERGMVLEPKLVMGESHALVWWRCEGRARIFYSALGHRPEAYADKANLALIDGAIGWAARRQGKGCG